MNPRLKTSHEAAHSWSYDNHQLSLMDLYEGFQKEVSLFLEIPEFPFYHALAWYPALVAHDIFRATVVSRIQYAAPAWSGMCSAADHTRLDSLLRRSKRLGYCSDDVLVVADLFNFSGDDFFHRVKTNSDHVLQPYLTDQTNIPYQLRNRSHNITLINKTKFLDDTDFIIRMLCKYSY